MRTRRVTVLMAPLLLCCTSGFAQRCLLQTQKSDHWSRSGQLLESISSIHVGKALGGPPEAQATTTDIDDLEAIVQEMIGKINSATAANTSSAQVASTVKDMVAEFQSFASDKFKTAFAVAQKAIADMVKKLGEHTKDVTQRKKDADDATKEGATCRLEEKAALKTYEDCRTEGIRLNISMWESCQAMSDALYYDKKNYNASTKKCKEARKAAGTQEHACIAKQGAFRVNRTGCDGVETQVNAKVCDFGTGLQGKCATYASLKQLIESTQSGTGTAQSEPDRTSQWKKAMKLKCMLKSYIGHGATNADVKAACEGKVDYARDVGVMDYMEKEVSSNFGPAPLFTCNETAVKFEGKHISRGNTTSKYIAGVYAPNIVLSPPGSPPFTFC